MVELVEAECRECGATRGIKKSRPVYHFHCPEDGCTGTMVRADVQERDV